MGVLQTNTEQRYNMYYRYDKLYRCCVCTKWQVGGLLWETYKVKRTPWFDYYYYNGVCSAECSELYLINPLAYESQPPTFIF